MPGIEVHVRIRPVASGNIWSSSDSLLFCTAKNDARFAFHRVHPASVTNATLYNTLEPLTHSAFSGQNVTVMAYGQTGSGKTFGMMGSSSDSGLIPRAAKTLMDLVHQYQHEGASIQCGYTEIYNENIYDLLAPKKREMQLRDAPDGTVIYVPKDPKIAMANNNNNNNDYEYSSATGVRIKKEREGSQCREGSVANNNNNNIDLSGLPPGASLQNGRILLSLNNIQDFENAVHMAENNRSYGVTDLNARSSRSHVILNFEITRRVGGQIQRSILQFVDLAGSESAHKANTTGSALAEGGHINKSLLALGNVVTAIVEKRQVISYRESNLTRILRNCLGGKGLTYLITCINPTKDNYEQTYQSLKFAERAMNIKSDPGITLSMAPLIVHQVWRSLRIRMNYMKESEERAYELGIQDTYNACRDSVGNIVASVDAEVQTLLQQNQTLANAVLAHDQQRALRAIQDAQQMVRHKGTTLSESDAALDYELGREEQIRTRHQDIDHLRADVDAAQSQLQVDEEQLANCRAELETKNVERFARQRDLVMLEHRAVAMQIDAEYWTELNDIAQGHFKMIFPGNNSNSVSSSSPVPLSQDGAAAGGGVTPSNNNNTNGHGAVAQLRELRQYKSRIEKEKKEIEELQEALNQINDFLVPDSTDDANNLTFIEDAHLSAHIEIMEANARAAKNHHHQQQASLRASPTANSTYGHLFSNNSNNNNSNNNNNTNGGNSIATAGSYYSANIPQMNNNNNNNNQYGSVRRESPRSNKNVVNKSATGISSRSVSPRAKIVKTAATTSQPNNNNSSNNNSRTVSPVPVAASSSSTTHMMMMQNNNNANLANSNQRPSAADILANTLKMFSAVEMDSAVSNNNNNNNTKTTTRIYNNNSSRSTSQQPQQQQQQQHIGSRRDRNGNNVLLPPRSPRPPTQQQQQQSQNYSSSTINNSSSTANENFQPIPSNSAYRAALRKEQQQARETRRLEGAGGGLNSNRGSLAPPHRSPTPQPHHHQQNNNNNNLGTGRKNNNNNNNNVGGGSAVKRTTKLMMHQQQENSRDRVDLNLFDGQSPVVPTATNNKGKGGGRGRK